jgi:hypothetical protein
MTDSDEYIGDDWFIIGSVFHSTAISAVDRHLAIRAIEFIMIEHDILKIDVSINPYGFPPTLINLRNGKA